MNASPTTSMYEIWDWLKRVAVGDRVTVNIVHEGLPNLKKNNISSSLCYMEKLGYLTQNKSIKGPRNSNIWQLALVLDDSKMNFEQSRVKECHREFNGKELKEKHTKALSLNDRLTIISDALLCLAEIVEDMKQETGK